MLGRSNGFPEALQQLAVTAPKPWLERVLKRQIIVHTHDNLTIVGVLMEHTADGIILRAAKLLGDDKRETAMAGETWVPRENVAFAQIDE